MTSVFDHHQIHAWHTNIERITFIAYLYSIEPKHIYNKHTKRWYIHSIYEANATQPVYKHIYFFYVLLLVTFWFICITIFDSIQQEMPVPSFSINRINKMPASTNLQTHIISYDGQSVNTYTHKHTHQKYNWLNRTAHVRWWVLLMWNMLLSLCVRVDRCCNLFNKAESLNYEVYTYILI